MSNAKLEVLRVHHSHFLHSARLLSFTPVLGRMWTREPSHDASVIKAIRKIRLRRAIKLEEFRSLGWKPLQSASGFSFALGCPPFGVISNKVAKPCHRPLVCPFCFARQYVLDRLFELEEVRVAAKQKKEALFAVGFRRVISEGVYHPTDKIGERAREMFRYACRVRSFLPELLNGQCGSTLIQLLATNKSGKVQLQASLSGIYLATRQIPEADVSKLQFKWAAYSHSKPLLVINTLTTQQKLASLARQVMRYRPDLLRLDPRQSVDILSALEGSRLSSSFGKKWARSYKT